MPAPAGTVEWSELPAELLSEISRKLPTFSEYLRFRAVCRSWRSAAKPGGVPPRAPCLLLDADPDGDSRSVYNSGTGSVHALRIPEARGKQICGSGHGWLALSERASPILTLLNPLTGSQISLPPSGIPGELVCGAFLSSNPSSGCVVAISVFDSQSLAFCRLGTEGWSCWSRIDTKLPLSRYGSYEVAYHKGKLYAANDSGVVAVAVYDVGVKEAAVATIPPPPSLESGRFMEEVYLVEDSGALLLAGSYILSERPFGEREYFVSKLDESCGEQPRWVGVRSMGGRSLFLCNCQSLSVSPSSAPGCSGDCLYIPENFLEQDKWHYNILVYHWRSYDIERLNCKLDCSRFARSPPAWLVPSLC